MNQPAWTDVMQAVMALLGPFAGAYIAYQYAVRQMNLNRDREFLLKIVYDVNQYKEARMRLWKARHQAGTAGPDLESKALDDINRLKGLMMAHKVGVEFIFCGKGEPARNALHNLLHAPPPAPEWAAFFHDLESRVVRVRSEIRKLWKILNPSASEHIETCDPEEEDAQWCDRD